MKTLLFAAIAIITFGFTTAGKNQPVKHGVHLSGTYESKKGVMHKISCYGFNIGYLTTEKGEKVVVCFDNLDNSADLKVDCENIAVQGHYSEKTIEGKGNCAAGTLKILYVEEWSCL